MGATETITDGVDGERIQGLMVRTRVGGVGRAVDWEAAVVAMARDLSYALNEGDANKACKLLQVIESWKDGNDKEKKAYAMFTRSNPYRKLYETANKLYGSKCSQDTSQNRS
ncbi:hypothetical protein GCM10007981_04510 [Thermocladium modestius]|uniref:Uncharacterized protein n=1 Tax=Thermocladium modestius TaxID=62609 RepID=A0A830GSH2_9CREN|nr:hypothetical protein [Thermocladium modestius]GGP19714.1 hypothetical protein GCM10007981_04510 [Thermocladium modestius]